VLGGLGRLVPNKLRLWAADDLITTCHRFLSCDTAPKAELLMKAAIHGRILCDRFV
jgi:hypothetical protein